MTRRPRSARRLHTPVAVALAATLVLMLPLQAQAQDIVENVSSDVRSGCLGVRHSPAAGYPGSFSALLVALDLAEFASRNILLRSTDGSGTTTEATVPVDEDGLLGTELPLVSFGPGTLEGEADGAPLDLGSLSTYQITDEERPCDVTDLPVAAPAPSETPSATPTAATEEPTSAATQAEPTSEPSATATDPDDEQEEAAEGGSLAWILLVGGFLLLLLGGWLWWPFGGGDDGGEDDGDDEDPRDAPPPVLYGEEISDPGYDWEVYLVTSGSFTDLATEGNTRVPIRTAEPGSTIVGTYFVAFTTEVVEHQSPWRSSDFQLRMLQGMQGEAEAALTGDPKADLWTDHWLKFEERLEGVAGDGGDGAFARGEARVRLHGWRSHSPWTSGSAQLSPYNQVTKRTGSTPTTSTSIHRQVIRMSVQFRPEGPAAGRTDEHLFSGRGTSGMRLETETECAWCKGTMNPSALCNPDMACVASGAFDVEAETHGGSTTFQYSNEDRQTKLSEIAKGGGIDATLAAPKVGIPVGPVTLTEIQLSVTKAQDHNKTQTLPKITGADQFDHAQSLRCTIRAAMSTAGTASVTPHGDTSVSSSLWDVDARGSASITHDLRMDAQVSSSWPYAQRPSLTVRLHDDRVGHGTITVEGKATSVSSPRADATGTRWWTTTPSKDTVPGPDAGE